MNQTPVVEIRITIDGQEVFGLFDADRALGCSESDKPYVLGVLSEALVMLCGTRPRKIEADVSVQRKAPTPVLSIVKD